MSETTNAPSGPLMYVWWGSLDVGCLAMSRMMRLVVFVWFLVFCGICFGGCIGVYGGVVFAVGFVWDVCYA